MSVHEIRLRSLGREDPLEEEMATHSSIWRILWTEEPGGLQSTHRVTKSWTQLKWHSTHCGLPVMKLQSQTYWNLVIILKVTVSKSLKNKILEPKYYTIIPIWVFSFFRLKLNFHRRKVFMCLALGLSSSCISALDCGCNYKVIT